MTRARRAAAVVAAALLLAVLSVVTVLRYTTDDLNADGVMQSVMSVQDVDLYFWGQDRLASVVPFLVSPVADPGLNLFLCAAVNALSLHGLLLLVARMGTRAVAGSRSWTATWVLFLTLVAAVHGLLTSGAMYSLAIDTQPYNLSYLAALGAYVLWRHGGWRRAVAVPLVAVATGLNPSVVLLVAALACVEMFRRRQWVRWPAFGAVWLVAFGVWQWLAGRYAGDTGPITPGEVTYFSFSIGRLVSGYRDVLGSVVAAFDPVPTAAALIVALLALAFLPAERRAVLAPRLGVAAGFTVLYAAFFAGNDWVAMNGYPWRYFYPVVMIAILCVATPVAGMALDLARRSETAPEVRAGRRWPWRGRAVVVPLLVAATVAALWGPLRTPDEAPVLAQTERIGQFVLDNDVAFVAGHYWVVVPTLHHALAEGRSAVYMTGYKSGGDRGGYHEAFERELGETDGPPLAVCVDDVVASCLEYLNHWTEPGWVETPRTCPVPGPGHRAVTLGAPPLIGCTVLEYPTDR